MVLLRPGEVTMVPGFLLAQFEGESAPSIVLLMYRVGGSTL